MMESEDMQEANTEGEATDDEPEEDDGWAQDVGFESLKRAMSAEVRGSPAEVVEPLESALWYVEPRLEFFPEEANGAFTKAFRVAERLVFRHVGFGAVADDESLGASVEKADRMTDGSIEGRT